MSQFPVLETRRLWLRELSPRDAAEVLAIYGNREVTRFSEMATLGNLPQAELVIRHFRADFTRGTGVRWGIALRSGPGLIGTCGLRWHWKNFSAELSYDLAEAHWGRGLASEAIGAVVDYTFGRAKVNRISATTTVDNKASMRVLTKLGFQREGILRDWGFWKGEFKDLCCFSLLRRDLKAEKAKTAPG